MKKKIKVFDYCWHIPHQWDMIHALRDDCEFYYVLTVFTQWNTAKRPFPPEIKFVTHYEPGLYDVAILHMDQSSIIPSCQKRMIYEHLNSVITDIPKIVLNHGTPVLPEYFSGENPSLTDVEMQKQCVNIIRDLIGDNVMVVNSHTAASEKEWGFGTPIVHGLSPDEWIDLPKEPRAFTALSPAGFDVYYNRDCMKSVMEELAEKYGHKLKYAKVNINLGRSPDAYRQYLGKSLLYIDTSFRTPMNRARTEAFLSGCCVIQVEGAHDLERWAKPGENIVLVPDDPGEIARVITDFLNNGYQKALAIGKKGKEMAIREFSPERYRKDWIQLLNQILN
jgi:glycosyltransferase involved in cell wall biosynthesis